MGYGAEMFGPLPTSFIIQLGDHSLQCLVDHVQLHHSSVGDMAMCGVS